MKPEQQSATPAGHPQSLKDIENVARQRMDKVIAALQHEMSTLRTGRASINLFDGIQVEAYGSTMPINHVATLHVPEPSLITIQPYDVSQIGLIEKSIRASDLGLNPSNDGKMIRVPIPVLTEERRKELVKHLHHAAEDHRILVRNVRRDANESTKKLLKDKAISEDDERRAIDDTQKLTDGYIAKIDQLSKGKEKEIMQV
ncbi:MAG: ribosome recycling factor [Bryobacteraceae bacterium]|jgi:ribosome recycling factor